MRTNVVLIDFENVQPDSLAELDADHFRVLVFVGASQEKIPFDIVCAMQRMGENAEYVKISSNGKNALDFHIAFYIGELVAKDPSSFFHIISKDTGFDPLIQHLKSRKIFAARSASIAEMPILKTTEDNSVVEAKLRSVLEKLALPLAEKLGLVLERLQQPKVGKPKTITALSNVINALFHRQIGEHEMVNILAELQKQKFIQVNNDESIVYLFA